MAIRDAGLEPHDARVDLWLPDFCVTPEGDAYSWEGREPLREIAIALATLPNIVAEKASQIGFTVTAMLVSFYLVLKGITPRGPIYFFPTDTDVEELVKTKANPLFENNYFGDRVGSTDHVHLKSFAGGFIYFRGVQSKVRTLAISGDVVLADEANLMTPEHLKLMEERIHASKVQWKRRFSKPSIPGIGIDREFQRSDQHYWTFRCRGCRREFDLETTFPESVAVVKGRGIRCCPKCKREVQTSEGRWLPRKPELKVRGYHLSQLMLPTVDPAELLEDFNSTDRPDIFYNGRLGIPYIEAGGNVSVDDVLSLCGPRPRVQRSDTPTYAGSDIGRRKHWVAWDRNPAGKPRVVAIEMANTFEDLEAALPAMRAHRWVCDAQPETERAIAFSRRHQGKVWLCYYSRQKPEPPKWSEDEERRFLRVDCNRTVTLDALVRAIREKSIELPKRDRMVELFAEQVAALVRVDVRNDKTGEVTQEFRSVGDDHFGHAAGYGLLALTSSSGPLRSMIYVSGRG